MWKRRGWWPIGRFWHAEMTPAEEAEYERKERKRVFEVSKLKDALLDMAQTHYPVGTRAYLAGSVPREPVVVAGHVIAGPISLYKGVPNNLYNIIVKCSSLTGETLEVPFPKLRKTRDKGRPGKEPPDG